MPNRVNTIRSGGMPLAPNMGPGVNHAENLRESAPLRKGLGRSDKGPAAGVRVVGEFPDPIGGKAVTAVAATDLFTSAGHGYQIGNVLKFSALTGGAGIVVGTRYYIIPSGFTANDFRVSATPGGAQLDVTSDLTAGTVTRQLPNSYAGTTNVGKRTRRRHPIPGPRTKGSN